MNGPLLGSTRVEAAVLGGGPAGSAAARLLAAWGHSVALLTRERPGPVPAESLPPSASKVLEVLGLAEAVARGGFLLSEGNSVWWGGESRVEAFPAGRYGYQVERPVLDRLLRAEAERAGARVIQAHVREASGPALGGPGPAFDPTSVVVAEGGRERRFLADWVLDCTGRTGIVARGGLRRRVETAATLAVAGEWTRPDGWAVEHPTHTLVESYRDGWAWSVPVSLERRTVTTMVDPRLTEMTRSGDLERTYRAELAKTERLRQLLDGARPLGPAYACSASTYTASRFGGAGFLLVGDAASFIDPLSSFGVKKALASGWLAAVVVHTALTDPARASIALDLFETRERRMYDVYREGSARFSARASQAHPHGFWEVRAGESQHEELDAGWFRGEADIERMRHHAGVLSAFEVLKARERLAVGVGGSLAWAEAPTVAGREVVLERRWRTPRLEGPVRFLRDIDTVALIERAPECGTVADLLARYEAQVGPAPLPDFLGALSVLLWAGALEWRGEP